MRSRRALASAFTSFSPVEEEEEEEEGEEEEEEVEEEGEVEEGVGEMPLGRVVLNSICFLAVALTTLSTYIPCKWTCWGSRAPTGTISSASRIVRRAPRAIAPPKLWVAYLVKGN